MVIVSNNSENSIQEYCDFNFCIANNSKQIEEIDDINKAPTISSFVFMAFLDILGVQLRNILGPFCEKDFILFHPGGALGQTQKIDHVIIVACGKGTRLYPYAKHIPKLLINIDNENMLCKQLRYWSRYTQKFVILIEEKYNEIVKFYCQYMNVYYTIKNIQINNGEENAYTIQLGLGSDYNNKNIIITWCDILFTEDLNINKLNHNVIFTYGNECRYMAENDQISKSKYGNIIGCFFIKNYQTIHNDNKKNDLCDIFLENFGSFQTYELNNIIDIGDIHKLETCRSQHLSPYKTRYFNKILKISDEHLKKIALDESGIRLLDNEKQFYRMLDVLNIHMLFPSIIEYGHDYMIMQNLHTHSACTINDNVQLLPDIFEKLNILHNVGSKLVSDETFWKDIQYEFHDKIVERNKKIQCLINYLDIKSINNVNIKYDFNYILSSIYKDIKTFYADKRKIYNIIHGDCQFSNILKDNDNKVIFVDPRGYFGKTKFYGIKEYDYSKVLYSLTGYDDFNNKDDYCFDYHSDTGNINTNISEICLHQFAEIFENCKIDFELCLKMCIIHWMGLAEYSKNNILKCISAYYHAIYLYHIYCLP